MASDHHQCHCHPTHYYHHPTPTTTTCYCTTTHYPSPPPVHSISSHHHLHAPTQSHNNYHPPPHQIQQKHQLYHQHEIVEENPSPLNPIVSSLVHRITALESTLRRRNNQSSLRDVAARAIQTHFRAFLVRRSATLRQLKDLAYIKSALNHLKSSVSNKTHFDSYFISRESMSLLIKLDSVQGSDPMIRDGKRSISRELIRFMEVIDQISKDTQKISVKNVRFSKISPSGSRVFRDNERKLVENLEKRINKIRVVPKTTEEDEVESLEIENPRKPGASKIRNEVKKNVSFNENGNVYRLIKSNRSLVLSDGSDSSNSDDEEEVEEIGVLSKETPVVEEEEILGTQIHHPIQKNQEVDEDEDVEDDSFVFSAPLPAKMEYRVESVNKKQTAKH